MNRDNDFMHPMENAYDDDQVNSEPILAWVCIVAVIVVASYFIYRYVSAGQQLLALAGAN